MYIILYIVCIIYIKYRTTYVIYLYYYVCYIFLYIYIQEMSVCFP